VFPYLLFSFLFLSLFLFFPITLQDRDDYEAKIAAAVAAALAAESKVNT
jgi:hypothetical protein